MPQLLDLPPSELIPNPKNPRNLPERDEDLPPDVREVLIRLGESMREKQLQPVLALPTKPKKQLVAGGRRRRAALLAGLPTIQVLVADKVMSEAESELWAIQENIHRENLNGWELFASFASVKEHHPGMSNDDLAKLLKVSPASVTRNLSPLKLGEDWRDALKAGNLGISHCYSASRADKSKHAGLLALALNKAPREELDKAAKPARKKGKAARITKIQLAMPDGVSLTVAAKSLTLDDLIGVFSSLHREAEAAKAQKLDASAFQAVLKSKARG